MPPSSLYSLFRQQGQSKLRNSLNGVLNERQDGRSSKRLVWLDVHRSINSRGLTVTWENNPPLKYSLYARYFGRAVGTFNNMPCYNRRAVFKLGTCDHSLKFRRQNIGGGFPGDCHFNGFHVAVQTVNGYFLLGHFTLLGLKGARANALRSSNR